MSLTLELPAGLTKRQRRWLDDAWPAITEQARELAGKAGGKTSRIVFHIGELNNHNQAMILHVDPQGGIAGMELVADWQDVV